MAIHHLKAGRALLQQALELPESKLNRETKAFLAERFAYMMTLSHISMGPKSDQWVLDDTAKLFLLMQTYSPDYHGAMSGCVHELFRLIPRVSILARRRRDEIDSGTGSWDTMNEYLELHAVISNWEPKSTDQTHIACGTLYQQALLLYLVASHENYGQSLQNPDEHPLLIQRAFETMASALESTPSDSVVSTTLCWPLAIFGSCARTEEHHEFVRKKLDILSSTYASQSVRDTKELLEMIWAENDPRTANPLSLELAMRRRKSMVLFL